VRLGENDQEPSPLSLFCREMTPAKIYRTSAISPRDFASLASIYQLPGARSRTSSIVTFEPRIRFSAAALLAVKLGSYHDMKHAPSVILALLEVAKGQQEWRDAQ
jgi:hypothetical protein